ncbi:hypothetical protein DMENIID0001_171070 [Sergentomyia squamirostris]
MAKNLADTDHPDVTFVFPNDGESTFATRKFKLAQWSEVFAKMFASGLESDRIIIKDITIGSFYKMIRHLNGEEITVDESNFLEMLHISRKYFLNTLTSKVYSYVQNYIVNSESILKYYPDIKKYHLTLLDNHIKRVCIRFPNEIIDNMNINCDDHLEMLKIILESDFLCISEFELYTKIMKMIKQTINDYTWDEVKGKLGKLIYLIRFPAMTVNELIQCAKPLSLLTVEQIMNLQLYVMEGIFTETLQLFPNIRPRINGMNQVATYNHSYTLKDLIPY